MEIDIREAKESDLSEILQLYKELEADNGSVLPLNQAETIFHKILGYPDYKIYIAVFNGNIIGTFTLAVMDNLAHMGAKSGLVEDVVVKSEWQGKGIGKLMMKHAMEQCRKNGCYKMSLSSGLKRENAHHFYEALGFEKHGYSYLVQI